MTKCLRLVHYLLSDLQIRFHCHLDHKILKKWPSPYIIHSYHTLNSWNFWQLQVNRIYVILYRLFRYLGWACHTASKTITNNVVSLYNCPVLQVSTYSSHEYWTVDCNIRLIKLSGFVCGHLRQASRSKGDHQSDRARGYCETTRGFILIKLLKLQRSSNSDSEN